MTSCIERRFNMAHKDQSGTAGSSHDQRSENEEQSMDARREDARAAFSQQDASGSGNGRMRDKMMNAMSSGERIGSGLADGVTNVAGGVIGIVRDTANTAIDGVGSVGQHAVHTLAGLLVDVVGGVRQVAGAAVGGVRSTAQEVFRHREESQPQDRQMQERQDKQEMQQARREPVQTKHETAGGEQTAIH
jgi:hypothetical protein